MKTRTQWRRNKFESGGHRSAGNFFW